MTIESGQRKSTDVEMLLLEIDRDENLGGIMIRQLADNLRHMFEQRVYYLLASGAFERVLNQDGRSLRSTISGDLIFLELCSDDTTRYYFSETGWVWKYKEPGKNVRSHVNGIEFINIFNDAMQTLGDILKREREVAL